MTNFSKKFNLIFLICLIFALSSCSLFQNKELMEKQKQEVEERKSKFKDLSEKILSNSLVKGTSSQDIKEMFGEPDDIFGSGSNVGSFAIWTYEQIIDEEGEEMGFQPIRLYFDNNKLISWKH